MTDEETMGDESKVRELFAPMKDVPIDVEGRRFQVDRAKVIDVILRGPAARDEAIAARARRRALTYALAAGFVVAIGAGGWFRARRPNDAAEAVRTLEIRDVEGEVAVVDHGSRRSVVPGVTSPVVPEGDLVTEIASRASVHAPDGLEVQLFENSRVALSDLRAGQSASTIRLDRGAIRCHVPHLPEGRYFSVVTPNATVVVHGTTFRVAIEPIAGNPTCVHVEEGVVTVTGAAGEARLEASQSWGCDAPRDALPRSVPTPSRPVGKSSATQVDPAAKAGPGVPPRTNGDAPHFAPGTLSEENRLFQAGLAAEHNGDTHAAAASFELLLSRHPQSPLAADARAALARVSAKTDAP